MAHDYKAFISYSHSADGKLAPALQEGLQKFACPWHQLRAIRVFRDKTGLTATPGLWKSIVTALDNSEYFLLLASPQSAQSHWVEQEVRHWLSQPRTDRLLIVLTEGEIGWDASSRAFDPHRTNALPPALQRLSEEPLWIDLRWAKASEQVSLQNPMFLDAIADLSSTLRGIPKDQLIGDDVRQHRRATRFRRSAFTGLILLTLGLALAAFLAWQQRNLALEQARIAFARQLAAQAELIRTSQPERFPLALLMAAAATQSDPDSMEAQQSLQSVLAQFPEPLATLRLDSGPVNMAVDSGMTVLAASVEKETTLWRLPDRTRLAPLPPFEQLVFASDGKTLAGCCRSVEVWTAGGSREFSLDLARLSGQPTSIALNHSGNLLAIGFLGRSGPGFEVRDLNTKQVVFRHEIELSGNPPALVFTPTNDLAVTVRDAVVLLPAGASEITTLASGVGSLDAIAISADGHFLAWSSQENVTVFDLQEHKESARLIADGDGPGRVLHLAFSADSQYLGAVGDLNIGAIWRGPNWREVAAPRHGELQTIQALTFHPSAPEAVTCASDGYCLSWSLSSGQKIRRFAHVHAYEGEDNRKRQILGAAFGASGSTLVTSGADGTARLWNVTPPGELERTVCEREPIIETFTPIGRQWSWPTANEPIVTPERCQGVSPPDARHRALVRDLTGQYVAVPQPVDVVDVWTPSRGTVAKVAHLDPVDWDAVQQRLIDQGLRSYRAYLPVIDRMKTEGSVRVLALSPGGKYLITAREADQKLRIWDIAVNQALFTEPMPRQQDSLFDFLSETTLLRVDRKNNGKGLLSVIDAPKASTVWSTPVEWPVAVTISDDRQVIAWADGREKQLTLHVRESATGRALFERHVEMEIKRLHVDAHNRFLLASVGEQPAMPSGLPFGGGLVLWRIADGKEIMTMPETEQIIAFAFSADSAYFGAVNRDGRLQVWDLTSGAVVSTVLRNPGPLAFSAADGWLAVGSGSVQILDRLSLRPVAQLDFPADTRHIEFQSNDRILAVTGFQPGDARGVTQRRYWQPADLLTEVCKRLPLVAAEAQWRQLFVDREPPVICGSSSLLNPVD